jgi:hypothetical protein
MSLPLETIAKLTTRYWWWCRVHNRIKHKKNWGEKMADIIQLPGVEYWGKSIVEMLADLNEKADDICRLNGLVYGCVEPIPKIGYCHNDDKNG